MKEYREIWITTRASGGAGKPGNRTPRTSYSRAMKAVREIGGIIEKVKYQEKCFDTSGSLSISEIR